MLMHHYPIAVAVLGVHNQFWYSHEHNERVNDRIRRGQRSITIKSSERKSNRKQELKYLNIIEKYIENPQSDG